MVIIVIAILTRIPLLDRWPDGFSGDEAGQGYTAYSLLKTGRDEWGEFLPLTPRTFGDYKAPLYSYLTIPSVALFGLNVTSVRLVSALVGVLSVITVYFLTYALLKNRSIAIWSSFILSINPWHIQLSRTAFEGNIGILLFCLGLLLILRGEKKLSQIFLASIFLGLTLFSYHAYRLFIILFIPTLVYVSSIHLPKKNYLILSVMILIFVLPLLLNSRGLFARASDVGIISSNTLSGFYQNRFKEEIGKDWSHADINHLFNNKAFFISNKFFANFLNYTSPTFFFTGDKDEDNYLNFSGFGLLYPVELILWIFAAYLLIVTRIPNRGFLALWFLIAPVSASLASGINSHRVITFLPLTAIFSGIGLVGLKNLLTEKYQVKIGIINTALICTLLLNLTFFLNYYFINPISKPSSSIRVGYKETFKKVLALENFYDQIVISKSFTVPQIFIAFYGRVDPQYYQQQSQDWLRYEGEGLKYIDQLGQWKLGKYFFKSLNWKDEESKKAATLVVGKAEEFPKDIKSLYDVKDSRGDPVYRIVSTDKNKTIP